MRIKAVLFDMDGVLVNTTQILSFFTFPSNINHSMLLVEIQRKTQEMFTKYNYKKDRPSIYEETDSLPI